MNAIYARQSVDKKDSLSIEGQIKLCRQLAGEDAKVFKDKGFSGKNIKRPAFTELIEAVKAGTVKKIFVYRLDRFSRSIADFGRLWELLEEHGVEFQSVTEQFDTSSPMGRAMLNIVLVFAQLERETTAERVKDNYIHRFKLGAWTGGPAPYGFDLTKITDGGRKVSSLVKNEKSEIVKFVFEEYAKADTSLRSIAKDLTEKRIHGPRREVWDNVTLSRLLHSPLYVKANEDIYLHYLAKGMQIQQEAEAFDGIHACNIICRRDHTKNKYNSLTDQMLTVSNHDGFIDSELWLCVQEKLAGNKQISRAKAGKYSWLTGLLKCAKCGYAVKVNYSKPDDKIYLKCSGRSNLGVCDSRISVDLRELEDYISRQIDGMLKEAPPTDIIPNSDGNAAEVLKIEQKIERLVNALAESGEIAVSYISKQIEALHREREELLKSCKPEYTTVRPLDFNSLSFDEKKLVAAQFIDKVLIEGKNVNIIWRI
ncbi:MAG: recombinase family protein [Acutalibacteraceae bacterium]